MSAGPKLGFSLSTHDRVLAGMIAPLETMPRRRLQVKPGESEIR